MKKTDYSSPECVGLDVMLSQAVLATSVGGASIDPVSGDENDYTDDWSEL